MFADDKEDILKVIGEICLNAVIESLQIISSLEADIFHISSIKANIAFDRFKAENPLIIFDSHDDYMAKFYLIPGNIHFLIRVKL